MLENHPDPLPGLSQFLARHRRKLLAIYSNRAAGWRLQQIDTAHQSGFPRSGETDYSKDPAFLNM
ncbi:hypothetical protein D3C71_1820110 [compost metagenome]